MQVLIPYVLIPKGYNLAMGLFPRPLPPPYNTSVIILIKTVV